MNMVGRLLRPSRPEKLKSGLIISVRDGPAIQQEVLCVPLHSYWKPKVAWKGIQIVARLHAMRVSVSLSLYLALSPDMRDHESLYWYLLNQLVRSNSAKQLWSKNAREVCRTPQVLMLYTTWEMATWTQWHQPSFQNGSQRWAALSRSAKGSPGHPTMNCWPLKLHHPPARPTTSSSLWETISWAYRPTL